MSGSTIPTMIGGGLAITSVLALAWHSGMINPKDKAPDRFIAPTESIHKIKPLIFNRSITN